MLFKKIKKKEPLKFYKLTFLTSVSYKIFKTNKIFCQIFCQILQKLMVTTIKN